MLSVVDSVFYNMGGARRLSRGSFYVFACDQVGLEVLGSWRSRGCSNRSQCLFRYHTVLERSVSMREESVVIWCARKGVGNFRLQFIMWLRTLKE